MEPTTGERDNSWGAVCVSLLTAGFLLALLTVVGADLMWLVAQGDVVRETETVPKAVPFAAAPTQGWPPVLVASQVALSLIHELGIGGLAIWHFSLVLGALVVIAVDARRRGAGDVATALVLGALLVGGVATFAVMRLQTFSLLPFSLTLLLVRAQHVRPTRAIWLAPVLVAVWGNLHGSVLLGVCVIGAHLLFSRLRRHPVETIAVGWASLVALFVTPATWRTGEYYLGVMRNEAAAQREGLWAAPSLTDPFDVLMITAVLVLGFLALRRRLPVWEYVAIAGLTVATLVAARNGVWLLLLLGAPAAIGLSRPTRERRPLARPATWVMVLNVAVVSACAGFLVHRTGAMTEADDQLAAGVRQAAPQMVVLAPAPAVESLAVHGVRVWLSNPLDAFSQADQRAYLDFLAGRSGMAAAVDASDAVLVREGDPADRVMAKLPGFGQQNLEGSWRIYIRE